MVGGILVLWVVSIALIHGYLVGRAMLPTYLRYAARDSKRALSALSMSSVVEGVEHTVDVAVIGGGPAGTTIAWLLQEREQCRVAIIDPNGNSEGTWYPNYGEWRDEWEALCRRLELPELRDCTTTEWEVTDTFFGGSFDLPEDDKLVLDRAYVRVDRKKMQRLIKDRFRRANGVVIESKLLSQLVAPNIFDDHLVHDSRGSTLTLLDGSRVRSKLVIDATGLESRLVAKEDPYLARGVDKPIPTGYQIAYGFLCRVDSMGPYDPKAMTLFDYRTGYLSDDPSWLKDAEDRPTFMYVMPLRTHPDGSHTVFWEETSLVGKDERRLSFEECKRRAYRRLQHHGIKVLEVEEEEYCYIPMGGEIPDLSQRVIGFGGAANMVHPSTGYHACRMMAAATDLSRAIGNTLQSDAATNTLTSTGSCTLPGTPDKVAAAAYRSMWSQSNRGQRDFQAYGGDFLMKQPVKILRGFFSAFFAVDQSVWSGFLAGWPGLPNNEHHETWDARLKFCLDLFFKMHNEVKLAMVLYAIEYTATYGTHTLLRSIMPPVLFGRGPPDPRWSPPPPSIGDVEAKAEARRLMRMFKSVEAAASAEDMSSSSANYPSPFQ